MLAAKHASQTIKKVSWGMSAWSTGHKPHCMAGCWTAYAMHVSHVAEFHARHTINRARRGTGCMVGRHRLHRAIGD